jgi:hypothetical protein
MSEGLPLKQITIIRIIAMAAGVLGAAVMLLEYQLFQVGLAKGSTLSNSLVALVGLGCLLNLLRHLRVLYRLRQG